MTAALLLSCEHASARVPTRYRDVFGGAATALASHRGSDHGAAALARQLARDFAAPLFEASVTRLLADANRSRRHPHLFSRWSLQLDPARREDVLRRYWSPHRDGVADAARQLLATHGAVVHVSVHSFTPHWRGADRQVDIGLLYDPARARERAFAGRWLAALGAADPTLRLRRNFPYRGTADGLTRDLRRAFAAGAYLGIELEVSQRFPHGAAGPWRRLRATIGATLRMALTGESGT